MSTESSPQALAADPSDPADAAFAARADAFAAQLLEAVNHGFVTLMLSIGHQLGLFDAMATLSSAGTHAIAARAGLHERYVREWLGTMVTGGIVRYEPGSDRYTLPPEHAACLTRAAGADNLAGLAQFLPLLATVEAPMLEVFREGGGLAYSAYARFHELMAEDTQAVQSASLIPAVLPLVDGLRDRLEAGIDALDVGCGRGVVSRLLARAFPRSRFVGIDIEADAIAWAQVEAKREELGNARFVVQDATTFTGDPRFDLITAFDAIHDQVAPHDALRVIRERLRPGGVFLMVDIGLSSHLERNLDHPLAPFLYTVSTLHCTAVSLGAGGEGLGACWGQERACELLRAAGFSDVAVERVEGDPVNAYYVCRAG